MPPKKAVLILGLPVLALAALIGALLSLRSGSTTTEAPPRRKTASSTPPADSLVPARPRVSRTPAPPEAVVQTSDEALFRGTYDNYRTAVATGNAAAQQSLEQAVRRKPELAMRFAQEELDAAKTESDRGIAMKTLEALRKQP